MSRHTALISGAGVAGPALAYWLSRAGFAPTLVERAPGPRAGGYVIDFWGLGYDIAEQMGLRGDLDRLGYHIRQVRVVGDQGERKAGFGAATFRELTGGRFVTVRRSDLARLLLEKASAVAEIVFGDAIAGLEPDGEAVRARFERAPPRRFDLVIGADGLHSQVRALAFGPQQRFEAPLGYGVAAFETRGYRPRDEDVYVIHNAPGRMLGRFALRDDRTLFLFVFTDDAGAAWPERDLSRQKRRLRERFAGGWESAPILDALDRSDDLYFDRVSLIRMEQWSKGRVALVGDAAHCASLMAGQGAALAMTGAYAVAGELAVAGGSHRVAFERYEALLRPYVEVKQNGAKRFSAAFAPRTPLGLFVRNLVIAAASIPGVARLAFGREMIDRLALPDYPWR
jgi:2-polyprenyl-6-methoxyphenol hydroxylase-like FAD-dependent oxidoreductase